ncbi:MAG TPA: YncE family protein [Casimicrobiaceae bacterium]|nr:YncE family protein [Casimicrobiaceae bacterium]
MTFEPRFVSAAFAVAMLLSQTAIAGQAPGPASAPDIPITSSDRVYMSDQTSNTVSVVDPATEKLLGVIRLGDPLPGSLNPRYRQQLLVHGMGFAPDHRTLAVVSTGSNSIAFIDTQTNVVKQVDYLGRAPHEAMYTPDGKEVWVTIRGEDYVQVIDARSLRLTDRIDVANGPGMTIFSPDGRYGYVCSSFSPETDVIDVKSHRIVARVPQASPFCPNIAATPDGRQVWLTLKDVGKTQVINAAPPFNTLAILDTGPITNHVNFARNANGQFAYVTVGGLNAVKVYTTNDQPRLVAVIPVGDLPHGIWPSGDGSRIYAGLENGTALAAIDTLRNAVVATIPTGQSPQAIAFVPQAVPSGPGTDNLAPIGASGEAVHLALVAVGTNDVKTTVAVNDQGLIDLLEAAASGLVPKQLYVLALAATKDGSGPLEPIARFAAGADGGAIPVTIGAFRRALTGGDEITPPRFLVIAHAGEGGQIGAVVQVQR